MSISGSIRVSVEELSKEGSTQLSAEGLYMKITLFISINCKKVRKFLVDLFCRTNWRFLQRWVKLKHGSVQLSFNICSQLNFKVPSEYQLISFKDSTSRKKATTLKASISSEERTIFSYSLFNGFSVMV